MLDSFFTIPASQKIAISLVHAVSCYIALLVLVPFILSIKKGTDQHRLWGKLYLLFMLIAYTSSQGIVVHDYNYSRFFYRNYLIASFVNATGFLFVLMGFFSVRYPKNYILQITCIIALFLCCIGIFTAPIHADAKNHYISLGILVLFAILRDLISIVKKRETYFKGVALHAHYILISFIYCVCFQAVTAPIGYDGIINLSLVLLSLLPVIYLATRSNISHFSFKRIVPTKLALLLAMGVPIIMYCQYEQIRVRSCPYMTYPPNKKNCDEPTKVFQNTVNYLKSLN